MRVLNTGCGTGESTFLAATLVGPAGLVVGVDTDHAALSAARRAADQACAVNVAFTEGDCTGPAMLGQAPFDAVVGRFSLIHQDDPALTLRQLARLVRPGGVMAFLEPELDYDLLTAPAIPLADQLHAWLRAGYRNAGLQTNIATAFPRLFLEAGLGWPSVRAYQTVSAAGTAGVCASLVNPVEKLLPVVSRSLRRTAGEMSAGDLMARLAEALLEAGGVTAGAPIAGAWVSVG